MVRLPENLRQCLISDAALARFGQFACFIAGPTVMILGLNAVSRLAATPGEVVLGVLGSSSVALLLVLLGLVLPLTVDGARSRS